MPIWFVSRKRPISQTSALMVKRTVTDESIIKKAKDWPSKTPGFSDPEEAVPGTSQKFFSFPFPAAPPRPSIGLKKIDLGTRKTEMAELKADARMVTTITPLTDQLPR
ncbi:hypothetical protein DESUT3_17390 [Desulfuromonas versatilis]|uniref:Uncharacterized protein n=1 Tax=Desulfuromonas versatilis TaxID=2802975 RepID=A0ABN6DX19_9BACT|nr:hypothetical protein DESUT3_17390 [Desulfuromonas versatilis]